MTDEQLGQEDQIVSHESGIRDDKGREYVVDESGNVTVKDAPAVNDDDQAPDDDGPPF